MRCNDKEIIRFFIKQCGKELDILKVAAGIWFLGVNSLDLLLDNFIGNVDFKKINII